MGSSAAKPQPFGKVAYDVNTQSFINKKDESVKLRPQSLAVFLYLLENRGRVVSKDELFAEVWKGVSVTDDSLVQCVTEIRRVLEDKERSILQTVPRQGYMLVAKADNQQIESEKSRNVGKYFRPELIIQKPAFWLPGLIILSLLSWIVPHFYPQPVADNPLPLQNSSADKPDAAANQTAGSVQQATYSVPTVSVNLADGFQAELKPSSDALLQELRVALRRYRVIEVVDNPQADYQLAVNAHGFGQQDSVQQAVVELKNGTGDLIFAESYDVPAQDKAIQQVAIRIAAAVASPGIGAVARHLRESSRLKPVVELTPSECYIYGFSCSKCSGEEDEITRRAEACLAHVLEQNPEDARAWALQATIYAHQYWYGNTLPEPARSNLPMRKHLPELAVKAANKAEAMSNGDDSSVYWGMVEAYYSSCQVDKLQQAINRGIEINPYDPNLLASFGNWLAYSGHWHEGAALIRQALEIEPNHYRKWWWMGLGKTHYRFGEDQQAYDMFMKAFNERNWVSHLQLAYTLPYLDRMEEAQVAVKKMLSLSPGITLERALEYYKTLCFDDVYLEKMKKALVMAGLPSRGSSEDFDNIQPPTAKTVSVNGVDVEYMDVGEGEPVLFVHGAMTDYRTWGYYLLPISENHRYIAYSRRYYGTQPWSDDGEKYSVSTYADDLVEFIKALDIGPVHLVTWSNSAPIAYLVKAKHPELVKSAIHYEPVTIDPLVDATQEEKAARKAHLATWAAVFSQLKAGDTEGSARRFMETVFELEAGDYINEKEITKEIFRQNAATIPVMFNPDYRKPEGMSCDFMQKISTPTLIVNGEKTNLYWGLMAKKFAQCTPAAEYKIMRGVNHRGPIEDFDQLANIILEFVDKYK
ncbi:MAG: alpha/beta fold hydrolase [Thiolinea sp.]